MAPAAQKWTNWLEYKIYGVIRHHEYELQVSIIEEIRQEVVELWQTTNTAFERRNYCVQVFPQVEQRQ